MRTPNCECVICGKPLYRRPGDLKKVRHVACMKHRAEAQKRSGITEAQHRGLAQGRRKGTNHREGSKHTASTKRKMSRSRKTWCAANVDKVKVSSKKTRGLNHYNWKGGSSRLNSSIRRLSEHRKWMDAVKERDGCCIECGSIDELESHHIIEFAILISLHGVKNRDDARLCGALWDISNGETLCQKCHCNRHGRKYTPSGRGRRYDYRRKGIRKDAITTSQTV